MNWIEEIRTLDLSANRYSQASEEIILAHIFENIGTTNKFYVDLGAGAYGEANSMSNTRLFKELGWEGLMIDKEARGVPDIKEYFITPQNICNILDSEGCPKEFDFLNVDIDSFDFYVLMAALEKFSPRVICTEFNASLPVNSSLVLKYEENYSHDGTNKYGYSFGAGKKLLEHFGYNLIYNHLNLDLFAVRNDIVKEKIEVSSEQIINFPINQNAVWENY